MAEEYELEEGQVVLCTVEKIVGTTVFVKIDNNGEGTIVLSEISPGRIRNLRDFVHPGKKIVCKVLEIEKGHIHLSLRRVKESEKKELLEKISKEKSYKAIVNTVLGKEKAEKILENIAQEVAILDFFEKAKEDPSILSKYFSSEESEKIKSILEAKKEKPKEVKQTFFLASKESDGIIKVKNILLKIAKDKYKINYLAAGRYSLSIQGTDFKELKHELQNAIKLLEESAKQQKCEFKLLK